MPTPADASAPERQPPYRLLLRTHLQGHCLFLAHSSPYALITPAPARLVRTLAHQLAYQHQPAPTHQDPTTRHAHAPPWPQTCLFPHQKRPHPCATTTEARTLTQQTCSGCLHQHAAILRTPQPCSPCTRPWHDPCSPRPVHDPCSPSQHQPVSPHGLPVTTPSTVHGHESPTVTPAASAMPSCSLPMSLCQHANDLHASLGD